MKLSKLLHFIIICISALVVSCGPTVTFTEPQPADTRNLSKFPKRIQGQYISTTDSSVLTIELNLVRRTHDYDFKFHFSQLDSNAHLKGDTLINLETNERQVIRRVGDSLVIHFHHEDTLFEMSEFNVLRKYKGYYFLNSQNGHNNWTVKKMQSFKNHMIISKIASKEDIDQLKELSGNDQDSSTTNFTVPKRQFKKFVKQGGFRDNEELIKIK